jgi:CRISPR-associated Csx2 family protein
MKKRTLITFLGNNNYRETTYVLDDTRFATRFMGMRLAEVLDVGTIRVLGTTGSMWDVLADALQATGNPEHWVELSDAVKENRVDATLLQRFENELNAPGGRRYELRLIPYGYGASDQVDVLQVMAEGLGARDELHLDITHGLRHLPIGGPDPGAGNLLRRIYARCARNARCASERAARNPELDPLSGPV